MYLPLFFAISGSLNVKRVVFIVDKAQLEFDVNYMHLLQDIDLTWKWDGISRCRNRMAATTMNRTYERMNRETSDSRN